MSSEGETLAECARPRAKTPAPPESASPSNGVASVFSWNSSPNARYPRAWLPSGGSALDIALA
jgi:hypothetical protein